MTTRVRASALNCNAFDSTTVLRACTAGFDAVDVSIAWDRNITAVEAAATLREMFAVVRAAGVRPASVTLRGAGGAIVSDDAGDAAHALEWTRCVQATAGEFECSACHFTPPTVATDDETDDVEVPYGRALNGIHAVMEELVLAAESAGVMLLIRAPWRGFLLSPIELRELVDSAQGAWIGVCLEATRLARVGTAGDWVDTLGSRIGCVRSATLDAFDALPEAVMLLKDASTN